MKRLLVVDDFQNDFITGSLGFEGAEDLIPPIAQKISSYRAAGDEIVFIFDQHDDDYLTTQEGAHLPVPHCAHATWGFEMPSEIEALRKDTDLVFVKHAFGSLDYITWLSRLSEEASIRGELPFESIEIVGLLSNICVISQVVLTKTACPEVPVIVDRRCTASNDPVMNDAAFNIMASLQVSIV